MIFSALSYPGSKRRMMEQLLPLFPDGIEDWREPFFGSGSVTIAFLQDNKSKDCKRLLVGDLAPEIWAYHKGIQENADKAIELVKEWFTEAVPSHGRFIRTSKEDEEAYQKYLDAAVEEGKVFFDKMKNLDTSKLSLPERAARTFIVNRLSFSGLGDSGTPTTQKIAVFRLEHADKMRESGKLLERVEIVNEPFQVTMSNTNADKSFVFLDPPYYAQEGSGLYGRDGDTHRGFPHKEFAEFTKGLNCKFMITYDDSPFVRRMFKGFNIEPIKFVYTMAQRASEDALDGEEVLITNYGISSDASYEDIDDIL